MKEGTIFKVRKGYDNMSNNIACFYPQTYKIAKISEISVTVSYNKDQLSTNYSIDEAETYFNEKIWVDVNEIS